jgi:chloride channel 3/4/5
MDLVYECFAKLGLRYICVVREGQYVGMVSCLLVVTLNSI